MAAAVFEALFDGSDEFEFDARPEAVVLWVTDDPTERADALPHHGGERPARLVAPA